MRTPLTSAMLAVLLAVLLGACAATPAPRERTVAEEEVTRQIAERGTATQAVANLAAASGSLVSGRVLMAQQDDGVRVRGEIGGLVRHGAHGLQVHERGDCSAVDASSAGRYYDAMAGARQDGAVGAEPGRIVADARGVAAVDLLIRGAVLGGGADNDIAGRALLVLGATPGAISARVACGIVTTAE